MSQNLTIAQISDTHIEATAGLSSYTQLDVREQLLAVLRRLAQKRLDLLVISGDLAAKAGEIEAYFWIREALKILPCPYLVMAGNHDNVKNMAFVFDLSPDDIINDMLCFSRVIAGKRLFLLDSSSYKISSQQLNWLHNQVRDNTAPALLFVHHPPLLCGCQFMDNYYPLQNIDEVWSQLANLRAIEHIFCGHYHTDLTIIHDGKYVHITPSTMAQIDRDNPKFVIAHTRPGWRMIEWSKEKVYTYVEFL